jgi:CDP-paratose 2-epimerase
VLEGKPITIYGDGYQVRDVLHVADLVDAMQAARENRKRTAGQVYNLGGGPERAVSIVEMLDAIAEETGARPELEYAPVRPGDQPLYISDTGKLTAHTGWRPRRSCAETLAAVHRFWLANRSTVEKQRSSGARQTVEQPIEQEVAV